MRHHGLVTVTIAEHRGDAGRNGNPRIVALAGYRAMQRLGRKYNDVAFGRLDDNRVAREDPLLLD